MNRTVLYYGTHWFKLAGVLFVCGAFLAGFFGDHLPRVQLILVYSLLALWAHQFEEYMLPGGAAVFLNVAFYGERKDYDRYPGNLLSMIVVNTIAWPLYAIAACLPQSYWLGLSTMYFGFFQVLGHGLFMNVRACTLYNPGMATALCLFGPIGVYYIWFLQRKHQLHSSDYSWAMAAFAAEIVVTIVLPVQLLKDRNTWYTMPAEEANRFDMVDKLALRGLIDRRLS